MSYLDEFESLEEEVKELLKNYKSKKATTYEPCTTSNIKECLIGLSEELELININYIFNPYVDFENNSLKPEALVKLINSVWIFLHYYKNNIEKTKGLMEQNNILQYTNKELNRSIERLKKSLNLEKNESRACVATAQRISDQSDEMLQNLSDTRSRLNVLKKQKEDKERALSNEITRLKLENEKLRDHLRNRSGKPFSPCSDVCDSTIIQLKEREKKQREIIAQLQANNQELLAEVAELKEDLLCGHRSNWRK